MSKGLLTVLHRQRWRYHRSKIVSAGRTTTNIHCPLFDQTYKSLFLLHLVETGPRWLRFGRWKALKNYKLESIFNIFISIIFSEEAYDVLLKYEFAFRKRKCVDFFVMCFFFFGERLWPSFKWCLSTLARWKPITVHWLGAANIQLRHHYNSREIQSNNRPTNQSCLYNNRPSPFDIIIIFRRWKIILLTFISS